MVINVVVDIGVLMRLKSQLLSRQLLGRVMFRILCIEGAT
jgi:hypothetical protein